MRKYPMQADLRSVKERSPATRNSPRPMTSITLWLAVMCLAGTGLAHAQDGNGVCRVTTAGSDSNNGSTWAQATTLPAALANSSCSEIWVAEGVYKPTVGTD